MRSVPLRLFFFLAVIMLLPAYFEAAGHVAWAQESQEICNNGLDDDGDEQIDEPQECSVEICDNGTDDDGDELTDTADPDCSCTTIIPGPDLVSITQATPTTCRTTLTPDPNGLPVIHRFDFPGGHSFKVAVIVLEPFTLEVVASTTSDAEIGARYPDSAEQCIPYDGATSTTLGTCVLYTTSGPQSSTGNPIANALQQPVDYIIAWDFPTLESFYSNPRYLLAEDGGSFSDITTNVFPTLQSGQDPGVGGRGDGFSEHVVVHQPGATGTLLPPLLTDVVVNEFKRGQTIAVKVQLADPSITDADLRISVTDEDHIPQEINPSGGSSTPNQLRFVASKKGNHYIFNLQTTNLQTGVVYDLTVAAGTDSGDVWTPQTVQIRLR